MLSDIETVREFKKMAISILGGLILIVMATIPTQYLLSNRTVVTETVTTTLIDGVITDTVNKMSTVRKPGLVASKGDITSLITLVIFYLIMFGVVLSGIWRLIRLEKEMMEIESQVNEYH